MKNADGNSLFGREHETEISDISFQNNVQMESHSSARKYCAGNVKGSTLNCSDSVSSCKTRISVLTVISQATSTSIFGSTAAPSSNTVTNAVEAVRGHLPCELYNGNDKDDNTDDETTVVCYAALTGVFLRLVSMVMNRKPVWRLIRRGRFYHAMHYE